MCPNHTLLLMVCVWVCGQSCPTLCNLMHCSFSGSSVHGISRILEWVAISFSRASSWPRDWTWVSCIAGGFFIIWATKEAQTVDMKWKYSTGSYQRISHFSSKIWMLFHTCHKLIISFEVFQVSAWAPYIDVLWLVTAVYSSFQM